MRIQIMDAIVAKSKDTLNNVPETQFREALKRMDDTTLIAFALDLGIDTDAILEVK